MCVGSAQMFSDAYLDKEDNGKLLEVIVNYLITGTHYLI